MFEYQFRRRTPIGNVRETRELEGSILQRKNDIKIGGMYDSDSNGHIYRHKNYRQIFLPLQVNISFKLQIIFSSVYFCYVLSLL